jgi:ADP-L-glycero-D-manno-heptose 6-epimerase
MKNILITGGAGFVGSNLALEIQEKYPSSSITIFDKFNNKERRTNKNYKYFGDFKNLTGFKGKVVSGDLQNISELNSILSNEFDVIFHQGAISDTTVLDQEEVIKTNLNSFYQILEYCKINKSKLIYASSAGTYGNSISPNIVGKGEIPENVYGYSKLQMDNIVRDYIIENPDLLIVGLRYFNVYGPGELYKRTTSSMILQLAKQAIDRKEVKLFKFGEQKRDFVYIKDVVQANLKAVNGKSGIYNVGSGVSREFNEIVSILSKCLNMKIDKKFIDNPYDFYQNNTCADISGAKNDFNYSPEYTLEDGISDYTKIILNYKNSDWKCFSE